MELQSISLPKKIKNHRKFYVLLSLLLLCCCAQYVWGVYIHQVFLLAVVFLIAITGDADEIAAMCMCCIPLHTFFEFAFAVLIGIVCYVIKNGNKMRLYGSSIIPFVLMVLWELLHCCIPDLNVMQFGGHCVTWIMLAIFMCTTKYQFDYGFIVRALVFTTTAICCMLIGKVFFTVDWNLSLVFINLQRLGFETEEATTKINPNTLGILCILGTTGMLQLRFANQGKNKDIFFIVALLLFGVMTASKTFLVCLAFMAMLFLCSMNKSINQKLRYVVNALIVGGIVLAISYIVMPDLLNYYISRFFEKDFTTGRIDTMGEYHKFIISNWGILFFGIGLQDFSARILQLCPQAVFVPHNGIQELILAWGVPGIILFSVLFGAMLAQSKKQYGKQSLTNFIPFLVLLLKIQAGQMLNSSYTMLTFSFTYLSMCANLSRSNGNTPQNTRNEITLKEDNAGIELWHGVSILWEKRWVLIAMTIAGALITFVLTKEFVTPLYKSTILLYVNNSNISVKNMAATISNGDIVASRSLVNTYGAVLRSRETINDVIELSGFHGNYETVNDMIIAYPVDNTEILKVVVENPDPDDAERIANAIAEILPVRISEIVDSTSAKVIEYAIAANSPSSPRKATNTMVGGVIGFVTGAMFLLLQAMRDTKIKAEEDLTSLFSYPVLAIIPKLADTETYLTHGKEALRRDHRK